MTSTLSLSLTASAIFLSACSLPVSIDADCAWTKPILFSDASKEWLIERMPWPEHFRADLIKIVRHNEKFETFCR